MVTNLATKSVTHFHSPTSASHCQLIDLCVVVYGQNVPLGEADCLNLISSTALGLVKSWKSLVRCWNLLKVATGNKDNLDHKNSMNLNQASSIIRF